MVLVVTNNTMMMLTWLLVEVVWRMTTDRISLPDLTGLQGLDGPCTAASGRYLEDLRFSVRLEEGQDDGQMCLASMVALLWPNMSTCFLSLPACYPSRHLAPEIVKVKVAVQDDGQIC